MTGPIGIIGTSVLRIVIPGLCFLSIVAHAQSDPPPNIVVLFSDQHRMASFPGEPYTDVIAPNLERLAGQGARFTNAISNYPVCSPFRAMLLTGRAPYNNGVLDNRMPMNDPGESVANVFQGAGYHTGYIGKWHLQMPATNTLEPFGFDESIVWEGTNSHFKSTYWDNTKSEWHKNTEYNAFTMAEQAVDFLERNRENPFMLYVSFNPPHSNFFDAPEEYRAHFQGRDLKRRPNALPEPIGQYERFSRGRWNDQTLAGYLAHIEALDNAVGDVLDRLDALNLSDNTIVIYTSDHGEMMLSHGRTGKRTPYEESIRIPFLLRWPGHVEPGSQPDAVFGNIDVAPTLLGLAGIESDYRFDGYDFAPMLLLGGDSPTDYQPIMHIQKSNATHGDDHPAERFRGVRTKRYTYAIDEDGPWLLFDNEEDPYQLENRIDDDKYRTVRESMHELVKEWQIKYNDPFDVEK